MTDTILSITAITNGIKMLLEECFLEVAVRGEVSNVRTQSSGHVYFTLKDEEAQLKAVLFRHAGAHQGRLIQMGRQLVVRGRLTVYAPRGEYSLVASSIEEDGFGALQRRFESLKAQLQGEGLFDPARKKPIPPLPRRIAVITSPSGAALRDFCGILQRRNWRGEICILPCRVQGQEATAEIIKQVERISLQDRPFDLVVLTRGGGSMEDLWCFNEEALVRAIAACPVPVISAIGHEIDFVLTDFAADWRAETPSGAAERISSAFAERRDRVEVLQRRLETDVKNSLERLQRRWELLFEKARRHAPQNRLERAWMRLDDLENQLRQLAKDYLQSSSLRCERLQQRLAQKHPKLHLENATRTLEGLGKRLETCSAHQTLRRGFAMVRNQEGNIVPSRAKIGRKRRMEIQFADGTVWVDRTLDGDQMQLDI